MISANAARRFGSSRASSSNTFLFSNESMTESIEQELNILNESAYDEWQTIINPVLKAQGTHDGLPLYTIGFNNDFMYEVEYSSVWDINANDDLIIEDGLTKEECEYVFMQISSGTNAPVINPFGRTSELP